MKTKYLLSLAITGLLASASPAMAQENDSTGMPGDQFSLQGALELFKKAGSPEEFEKLLNTSSNHVNNLDLDGDDQIDYIKVISKQEGDAHVFILQVAVTENENQDVAVIELEKTGGETASLQIIGDKELYGDETIIEPGDPEEAFTGNLNDEEVKGPYATNEVYKDAGVFVNVWFWPCVRFVYAPGYRLWVSPWRYHYYPVWWKPWRPLGWSIWHPYRRFYYPHYRVVGAPRMIRAHRIYTPFRSTSVIVHTRHEVARKNYTVIRSRTTVTGPRGNTATRKTTTIRGRNGKVRGNKSSYKGRREDWK